MFPTLAGTIASLRPGELREERRRILDRLASFVANRNALEEPARLVFVCTHNSRRSQLAQAWARAMVAHVGALNIESYSAGTEVTAFNPRAADALARAGFEVSGTDGDNPRMRVRYAEGAPTLECFSKLMDDPANPSADFAAVMTCKGADEGCPVVGGASLRISLPYDDPKAFDGTPSEALAYDERSRQIATEMLYLAQRALSLG